MKIVCTQNELNNLIRLCEKAQYFAHHPCTGCVFRAFCPDGGGIEDSEIIEVVRES